MGTIDTLVATELLKVAQLLKAGWKDMGTIPGDSRKRHLWKDDDTGEERKQITKPKTPGVEKEKVGPSIAPAQPTLKTTPPESGVDFNQLRQQIHKVDPDPRKLAIQEKDHKRINDIVNKAGQAKGEGTFVLSVPKMKSLVGRMAKSIKDPAKAWRRGIAMRDAGRGKSPKVAEFFNKMADKFFNRAKELIGGETKKPSVKPDSGWKTVTPKPKTEKPAPAKPATPPVEGGLHKVKVSKKSLAHIKEILRAHGLKGDEDELQELAAFKKTIGQRVPEERKRWVRSEAKLKRDFLTKMNPANYESREAFDRAKERIQKMSVSDFGKILAAIMSEDEDEEIAKPAKAVSEILKVAKDLLAMDYEYTYDPQHKKRPRGGGWQETEEGWSRGKEPATKENVENAIRDHLSGTKTIIKPREMFGVLQKKFGKDLTPQMFNQAWKGLIKDKYLRPHGGGYQWEKVDFGVNQPSSKIKDIGFMKWEGAGNKSSK